jgi:hypothetical protein
MKENRHLGKIAFVVGGPAEGTGKTADEPGKSARR